jgi:thioredoxin reductase
LIGAIGRIPKMEFISDRLRNQVEELKKEQLLYFIGDVKNGIFRQTSIAVGDGVRAAMQIHSKLKENVL